MAWVHDLDPVLVAIGKLEIRWYGLSYLAGLLLGWWWLRRWQRQDRLPLAKPDAVADFVTCAGIGMVVGGRLGFCLFYDPALLWTFSDSLPWWNALAVHKGGMASHGGIVGLAVGTWWYARRQGIPMGILADVVSAAGPLGVACGRMANFINGELWGRPTRSDWGVQFPEQIRGLAAIPPEPAFRSPEWYDWVRHYATPVHPSQLYAVALEGLLIAAIAIPIHARHRRPWLTSGVVLALYGVGRFVGEFFRQPDAGQPGGVPLHDTPPELIVTLADGSRMVEPILGFMSKGQALTIPVFLAGLAMCWWAWRRGPRPGAYALSGIPPAAPPPPSAG